MTKIRILAITARYPPHHFGGYEIRLKNIFDELNHKGHTIRVISSAKETSLAPPTGQADEYPIFRRLHIRKKARHFINEVILDWQDTELLDHQIKDFQPDVIYLGHIQPLSKAIMPYLASCNIPIVFDEGGSGLIHSWEHQGIWFYFVNEYASRYAILNKIKPLVVELVSKVSGNRIKSQWIWPDHMWIIFNSELNRRNAVAKGIPISGARVIHSGVDTGKFGFTPKKNLGSPLSFIFPGRIEPNKGQLDAVRLLAKLTECGIHARILFVGENWINSYYLEIEKEMTAFHLEDKITLLPMVTQEELADLYHKADICFFSSHYKTGYSRIPLEAMACGCIVISYGNEGSDEIIRNKQTGFLFPTEDFQGILDVIKDLISNPQTVKDITQEARKDIEEIYSIKKYGSRIEEVVLQAAGAR
jgi:glycosyltransferase involved in cell wall biosynthesis